MNRGIPLLLLAIVLLVIDLAAGRRQPTLLELDNRVTAHDIRLESLEKAIRADGSPISRYCVNTYAGVLECWGCKIVEDRGK